jgi:hypothetical protein
MSGAILAVMLVGLIRVKRVHSGRTVSIGGIPGQTFSEWDVAGFKRNILGQFMKFLLETSDREYSSNFGGDVDADLK